MTSEFFRVSELNQFIKNVLNAGFPQPVWVCGELQQYDRNKTKSHVFFELVEKDETTRDITARIGLVIFANRKQIILNKLKKSESIFELKDDIEVKFLCNVDFYAPHGCVRLIVEDIDLFYTLGKLAQERLKLIAKLKEKGTLDKNKKRELPIVPLRIGLITAFDSAAYNDFISELKCSGLGFNVFLRNAVMQGKRTEADIVNAIDELHKIAGLDLIVITRGGGSIAELSCFDSELIANRIADSELPVISGIGHEINITITDFAAHTFLKTPTAVAQFLVEKVCAFKDSIDKLKMEMLDLSQDFIENRRQNLRDKAYRLHNCTNRFLKFHEMELVKVTGAIINKPADKVRDGFRHLSESQLKLSQGIHRRMSDECKRLNSCVKMLAVLRPEHTLKRGFSITRDETGKTVKNVSYLNENAIITTELFDGIIKSKVDSINKFK